jgi:hypothetical protein
MPITIIAIPTNPKSAGLNILASINTVTSEINFHTPNDNEVQNRPLAILLPKLFCCGGLLTSIVHTFALLSVDYYLCFLYSR